MTEHHHAVNNEELVAKLQRVEKALKASEQLKMKAIAKKGAYEQQLKDNESELKLLGTTPEKAEQEVREIEIEIQRTLEKIEGMIPFELLERYKMLQ
ncbi:hypothetical protein [Paenibacillus polymyxa]|uniref:Uncharacterized protein n=1 Tax=Paenibacillus polymyxa (strain SC2) TaxID=886882 RepID=E3EKE8_PAEPS|nr:hypothetical protein [Paenibacillus polymyxa]ADO59475.1 hypothetical protein PPSC2_27695 [Paenibacillus polymyxa SC2]WPQ59687.1 hypothetical protein SKN87_28935 [Paenibacillus polymyxa]